MGGGIAFLESRGQVDAVLKLPGRPEVLIPLSPAAAWRLENSGVSYRKAESFYDERALLARMDDILDAQTIWANGVDNWLQERVPEFREADFRPAQLHFFFLKVMFDALRLRAHVLDSVWTELKPGEVVYFDDGNRPTPTPWLYFREGLHGRCLPPWAEAHGIRLEKHPFQGDERFDRPGRKAWTRLAGLPGKAARRLRRLLPGPGERVLTWPDFDVPPVEEALRARGLSPRSWPDFVRSLPPPDGSLTLPATPPWEDGSLRGHWDAVLRPCGLDLTDVARSRLELWWHRVIPEAWSAFQGARRRLRIGRYRGVLVPVVNSHQEEAALAAARTEDIPVHIYQHGGFGGNCAYPIEEQQDLLLADNRFCYGEGYLEHYGPRLRRYPGRRARIVPVGSARLDALRTRPETDGLRRTLSAGARHDTPLILYFPGMHAGYGRYLSGGEMPDVTHWELQRDIIRLFERFPSVRLVYRPFEGYFESPIPDLIAHELPSARIAREGTLLELAWAADAVLCDIPSTGLLEVLLTDRPVLVYSDARSIGLLPEAKARLERRASVDESPEAFLSRLEAFLATGDLRPLEKPDRSFLKAYGTHLDDGLSAERVASIVAGGPDA